MSEIDVLRRLGDQLVPPALDALRETARRRDRRNAIATATASGVAVIAVVATIVVVGGNERDGSPRPVEPPRAPTTRPLTYAEGPTIHYGDQTLDAAGKVVELDLTDYGVAFRTQDGGIGFTDGSTVDLVSDLGEPGPVYRGDTAPLLVHDGWLVSAHSGTLVAWFEFPRLGQPYVVAYDTESREVLSRTAVSLDDGGALPAFVSDRYVYWYDEPDPGVEGVDSSVVRYDPTTGDQTPATPAQVRDDLGSDGPGRTILIGEEGAPGSLRVTDGTDRNFGIDGGRVHPLGAGDMVAEDGLTGKRFAFDAPPGYPPNTLVWLTQWIDDDTIVLLSQTKKGDDLIECRVSTGACEVVLSGSGSVVAPEVG